MVLGLCLVDLCIFVIWIRRMTVLLNLYFNLSCRFMSNIFYWTIFCTSNTITSKKENICYTSLFLEVFQNDQIIFNQWKIFEIFFLWEIFVCFSFCWVIINHICKNILLNLIDCIRILIDFFFFYVTFWLFYFKCF